MTRKLVAFVTALVVALHFNTAAQANNSKSINVGKTFIAASLDPGEGSVGWALTTHGVSENLYTLDRQGRLVPNLAKSVQSIDAHKFRVTMAPGHKFSDGSPVDAQSVAAALMRTNKLNGRARATAGKLSAQAIDAHTVEISTEKPVPLPTAMLAEWAMVIYKVEAGRFLFTGPYQVRKVGPGEALDLEPNPHFADADGRPQIRLRKFSDPQTLAIALEAGELDLAFGLPVEALSRLKVRGNVTVKSFQVAYQYMMVFNTERALLGDPAVRQAIDRSIDRNQLAAAIKGGTPATGAYSSYFPFALKEPRPFDPADANKRLDDAGWKRGDDGIRSKDGKRLALSLYAYPQRPDLLTFQPVIKAMLSKVGIAVQTHVSDNIGALAKSGDFDLALWATNTAPSGEPSFFLNAFLRQGTGYNHARYKSDAFGAIVDRMAATGSPDVRAKLAADAHAVLFKDVPVSFLLTPDWHVGLSKRLSGYEPWGSDYYIIRPDLRVGTN